MHKGIRVYLTIYNYLRDSYSSSMQAREKSSVEELKQFHVINLCVYLR